MRQVLRVLSVVVAGGFAFTAVAPPAAAGIDGDRFQVVARPSTEHYEDTGPRGPSVGDSFTFSDKLYNRGERVGRDDGRCAVTRSSKKMLTFHCTVTLTLRGNGTIAVQGTITFKRGVSDTTAPLAITGGTRQYAGAAGSVTLVDERGEPQRLRVQLSG